MIFPQNRNALEAVFSETIISSGATLKDIW